MSPIESRSQLRIELQALDQDGADTATMKEEVPQIACISSLHNTILDTSGAPASKKSTYRIPHYWTDVVDDNDDDDNDEDNVWRAAKARQQQQLQSMIDMLMMFAGRVLMWWFLGAEKLCPDE